MNYRNITKQIKLVVTDIDNTLLRSDKSVSSYTKSVIEQCRAKDILIAFATARSENSCDSLIKILKPDAIISNCGAAVRYKDKVIHHVAIEKETTNSLLRELLKIPEVKHINVDSEKGYLIDQPVNEDSSWMIEYYPAYHVDFSQSIDCDSYKIAIMISDETIAYELASCFSEIEAFPFSGEGWICYTSKNADKYKGIEALASHINIFNHDILAFGDDFHDVEMLKRCGIGVAVSNAVDEAKAAADFICDDCNEDGVAKWLEKYVIGSGSF